MKSKRYVALLRGINVGGVNIIKMAALKSCFENLGLTDVATFIQSGNVLFSTPIIDQALLGRRIEAALSKQFKYTSKVVVVSLDMLKHVVADAPKGFGARPEAYRYDVIFLKEPLTPQRAMKAVEIKEGVDAVSSGKHVLYFARLTSKATQSRLNRIIQKPEYQDMTIRNWNTTTRLLELMMRS